MLNIRSLYIWLLALGGHTIVAQTGDIRGKILAKHDVNGIHILNTSSKSFTISNEDGSFIISAKLNDTLIISGLIYDLAQVVVTQEMMVSRSLKVSLDEHITILDEVVVGKVLSGDLSLDLDNLSLKHQPNFYDLGIKGDIGQPKTQTERRLYEASSGGGFIPLNPIINAITGRTKRIKKQVKLETLDVCLDQMKSTFYDNLFSNYYMEETRRAAYFYYCQEDPQFESFCETYKDMKTFEFLVAKLESFKTIIKAGGEPLNAL